MKRYPNDLSISQSAIRRLAIGLLAARRMHKSKKSGSDRRAAYQLSIQSMISFLGTIPGVAGSGVSDHLVELLIALNDVDDGILPLVFRPANGARAPDVAWKRNTRAVSAIALNELLKTGCGLEASAREVARVLIKNGFSVGSARNESSAAKTVISWRTNIVSRNPKKSRKSSAVLDLKKSSGIARFKNGDAQNTSAHIASDEERLMYEEFRQFLQSVQGLSVDRVRFCILEALDAVLKRHCRPIIEELY